MSKIEFTSQQKKKMAGLLQDYLSDEVDMEIGQFDAEFLADFIIQKFGPAFYNQGVLDAQTILQRKLLDIADELYEIEQADELQ
ncbi:DUF2164 domain-containing protein [Vibrio renipiscarius]|uniref:DUF2164 domain-containing protein n=1 Tax=Vibrio renipiscarius TaxID=1461322 RepID=A0A0C2JLE0_9VIBR|nr:DUF2164 domain-containing protein [Vibrio renipiscarius]KII75431.1 hypothetical protein OJ16_19330 [Vibrio renipiscarius]KII78884.1 hypothetical protein PL18_11440 [Vibrio renipiscarius]